jgi:hypothetical protein
VQARGAERLLSDLGRPYLTTTVRGVLVLITVIAPLFGTYLLWRTHMWLTEQRNIRRRLERLLGFYDSGVYGPESVLPYGSRLVHPRFQVVDLVLPMVFGMIMTSVLVIYLLLNVR